MLDERRTRINHPTSFRVQRPALARSWLRSNSRFKISSSATLRLEASGFSGCALSANVSGQPYAAATARSKLRWATETLPVNGVRIRISSMSQATTSEGLSSRAA